MFLLSDFPTQIKAFGGTEHYIKQGPSREEMKSRTNKQIEQEQQEPPWTRIAVGLQ